MARPGWPERNRAARSFRQLRRFHHVINSDKVFGTHSDRVTSLLGFQVAMRQLVAQAAKGNGPALRTLIEQTLKLEQDQEAREVTDAEAKLSRW